MEYFADSLFSEARQQQQQQHASAKTKKWRDEQKSRQSQTPLRRSLIKSSII